MLLIFASSHSWELVYCLDYGGRTIINSPWQITGNCYQIYNLFVQLAYHHPLQIFPSRRGCHSVCHCLQSQFAGVSRKATTVKHERVRAIPIHITYGGATGLREQTRGRAEIRRNLWRSPSSTQLTAGLASRLDYMLLWTLPSVKYVEMKIQ